MSLVRSLAAASMRGALGAAALVSALALSACGGNVSRSEPYVPERLVAFGDELSVIESNGHKYTINAVDATNTTTFVCNSNPTWPQYLAQGYDFYFAQCNPNNVTAKAFSYATVGAKVADVAAQFAANGAGFNSKTLVTVMVGMNDVFDLYQQVINNTITRTDAIAQIGVRGNALGQLIAQMADSGRGARVVFALLPQLQFSPFVLGEEAAHPGEQRQSLVASLVAEFNRTSRLVNNNGRWVALVNEAEEIVGSMRTFPTNYGLSSTDTTSTTAAGCTVLLPDCTTSTVQNTALLYLWADSTRVGSVVHSNIGSRALFKARNNPF